MPPSDPKEIALHAWSAFGVALCGLLIVVGWKGADAFGSDHDDGGPDLDDMEAIEASLAYKKAEPQKQPQKKKKAPTPEVKPEGVSRDDQKVPVPDKKDEPKTKPDDVVDPLADFRRPDPDELDQGKVADEDVGQFDGSEFGFADVTKGDEYWQHLIADMRWEYPALLAGDGVPVGCLHLELDGKVTEIKLQTRSGNDELDDSVEFALKTLKQARDEQPVPVPDRLQKQTRKWICFKFTVK